MVKQNARAILFSAFAALPTGGALADMVIAIDSLTYRGVTAQGLRLEIAPAGASVAFDLRVDRLTLPMSDRVYAGTRLKCVAPAAAGPFNCKGKLKLGGAQNEIELNIAQIDAQRLKISVPGGARALFSLEGDTKLLAESIPAEWAAPWLEKIVPGLSTVSGKLDGELSLRDSVASLQWRASGFGFDTQDGARAAGNVDAEGKLDWSAPQNRLRGAAKLRSGSVLISPFFAEVPPTAVDLSIEARLTENGGWAIDDWRFTDTPTMVAQGKAQWAENPADSFFEITKMQARFPGAYTRYGKSWLAQFSLGALELSGEAEASAAWRHDGAQARVALDLPVIEDQVAAWRVDGLQATIHWAPKSAEPSVIAWRAAKVKNVPITGGEIRLALAPGDYRLLAPLKMETLGGTIGVSEWRWSEQGLALNLQAQGLGLSQLARAQGWPDLGGTLDAELALRPEHAISPYRFQGRMQAETLGGKIVFDRIGMERPFTQTAAIESDVAIDGLDLAKLTQLFSWGTIEGRLIGKAERLRLVGGEPVAFDALLRTDPDYSGKRRISYRAVSQLSSITGGAAGLQQGLLGLFDSFSYDAIQLRMKLEDNVCTIDGIEPFKQGYVIMRGTGLPRLTIVGYRRKVDWPVFIERIHAVTRGTAEIKIE